MLWDYYPFKQKYTGSQLPIVSPEPLPLGSAVSFSRASAISSLLQAVAHPWVCTPLPHTPPTRALGLKEGWTQAQQGAGDHEPHRPSLTRVSRVWLSRAPPRFLSLTSQSASGQLL